ncbi:glycoside hydrolase family 6 protein [Actinoplanes sp. M2I2]|uniref:glycoside hydrolase family 6 protein n=1 Tax=Actinoplanes sp. M2I2 TaxID=1734444 RepID=UPI0020225733|nr:glycoside hydrolase family 6 protein [Actinoplanes sp. M2I2]
MLAASAALAVVAVTTGVAVTMAVRGDDQPIAPVFADGGPSSTGSASPAPPSPAVSAPGSASAAPTTPPTSRPATKSAGSPAASGGALAGKNLYVDRTGAAVKQLRDFQAAGRDADARLIREIADQPTATWFADTAPGYTTRARKLVTGAAGAGRLPVLTMYNIPHRDCSGQSAGGASGADAYRSYVASMANAMAGHPAVVILEPDAVPQAVQGCLDPGRTAERFALLGEAIDTLRKNPGVVVYLDAGNPSWITDTEKMAAALRTAGVARSNGFSLNVANFESTAANREYGTALSGHLDGARFVIDTSRNGNGPAPRGPNGNEHWCNPPDRSLGEPPTTRTNHKLVDAYLWIKRPGESDGACGNGAPPAGQWWADYALGLAR